MKSNGSRSVQERVVEAVVAVTGRDAEDVTLDAELAADLAVVELDLVEIVILLEDEFDFAIDEEAADEWKHVRDVVGYLEKQVGEDRDAAAV